MLCQVKATELSFLRVAGIDRKSIVVPTTRSPLNYLAPAICPLYTKLWRTGLCTCSWGPWLNGTKLGDWAIWDSWLNCRKYGKQVQILAILSRIPSVQWPKITKWVLRHASSNLTDLHLCRVSDPQRWVTQKSKMLSWHSPDYCWGRDILNRLYRNMIKVSNKHYISENSSTT